ncbi:DUF805 domain-containing protein [Flavobacterium sp. ARAG 55.4]|uniref:DUF805 domain-containing protein n=1 Tax=Flavobacterium sp. ARAG 55.4 TaxID=3451357 RepID=UPI003F48B19F
MIEWYKKVIFENYANFSGRARRSEYWYFILANVIIGTILSVLDNVLGFKLGSSNSGVLGSLYNLAVFVPGLAVSVRRLHDIGKSGKLLLLFYGIIFISVIVMVVSGFSVFMSGNFSMSSLGVAFFAPLLVVLAMSIWMLVLYCTEGDQGPNKYGSDPKNDAAEINEIGTSQL